MRGGTGIDLHQGLAEFRQVVGEFERHVAGEREQGYAFLRRYPLFNVLQRGHAGVHQVFELEMDVVEDKRDEAGGHHQLGAFGGGFARDSLGWAGHCAAGLGTALPSIANCAMDCGLPRSVS